MFVDVGSGDYKEMSTTYYLENHLEWSGIGVDALPEYAEGYERHRPATKFLNYIVTDHAGTTEPFYKVESMRELSATDEKLARQFGPVEVIEVPTITLTDLLDRNGISRIDLLSMDIEESEPEALAGFDIDRFKPRLVCIEAHPSVQEQILEYFDRHGYERIDEYLEHDELNWYFRPEANSS